MKLQISPVHAKSKHFRVRLHKLVLRDHNNDRNKNENENKNNSSTHTLDSIFNSTLLLHREHDTNPPVQYLRNYVGSRISNTNTPMSYMQKLSGEC